MEPASFRDYSQRLHRCGHGFGLDNHERPWLANGSQDVLQENMVVSIEPGLYLSEMGGFRHSDTVVITADGYRCLTQAPTQLQDLIKPQRTLRKTVTAWFVRRNLGLNQTKLN